MYILLATQDLNRIFHAMGEQTSQCMQAHTQTGTQSWDYKTAAIDLPVQAGALMKLIMQREGLRYKGDLSEDNIKEKISDELVDILSLVTFIARELNISLGDAWNKMLESEHKKVQTRISSF